MFNKTNLIHTPVFAAIYLLALTAGICGQYKPLSQSYGLLSTVAGKGGSGDGDLNEWNKDFEGKPAKDAILSNPHFAMADSAGNIYIADKNAHAIRKVDAQGIITTVAGVDSAGDGADGRAAGQALNFPNGLWVNKKGEFYILDLGNSKVRKVDIAGNMTTLFKDSSGISLGRGLWVSRTEDTVWYASATVVKMWTAAGGIVTYASGFKALGNIVQDKNGFLVATDRSGHLVYRINNQGTSVVIAGNGSSSGGGDGSEAIKTGFNEVRGIWFLDDNSYFLATHEGSQVWFVDNQGISHLFLDGKNGDSNHGGDGENYNTPGLKVSEVRSVTVDYRGNVLIVENDRGFVRKIDKTDVGIIAGRGAGSMRQSQMQIHRHGSSVLLTYRHCGADRAAVRIVNQLGQTVDVPMIYRMSGGINEVLLKTAGLQCGTYYIMAESGPVSLNTPLMIVR